MEAGGGEGGDGGEEDIVVDDQPMVPPSARNDSLASNPPEKLFSLEQAILASIDRCRKLQIYKIHFSNVINVNIYIFFFVMKYCKIILGRYTKKKKKKNPLLYQQIRVFSFQTLLKSKIFTRSIALCGQRVAWVPCM